MLKILTAPNNRLNTTVKPVDKIDDKITELVKAMVKTLVAQDDPPGVGLAAPQIGQNLALFIVKPSKKSKTLVFINPQVIKFEIRNLKFKKNSKSKIQKKSGFKLEGCLSIPRIWGPVKRADRILVEFQDLTGKVNQQSFGGLTAIIIQHEIDHLNGILFTQRTLEQKFPLYEEKNGQLEKIDY